MQVLVIDARPVSRLPWRPILTAAALALALSSPTLAAPSGYRAGSMAGKGVLWLAPKLGPLLYAAVASNPMATPVTLADKIVTLVEGMTKADVLKLAEWLLGSWVRGF